MYPASSAFLNAVKANTRKYYWTSGITTKTRLFIYMLTNFESRATIDVDFLFHGFSGSMGDVKK